jgi:hypothetical protein
VRLVATQALGNNTTAAPINISREVLKPRKTPAATATPTKNIAVVTTALKRRFLVVAKGAEATCLAKVNLAPFTCGGECSGKP